MTAKRIGLISVSIEEVSLDDGDALLRVKWEQEPADPGERPVNRGTNNYGILTLTDDDVALLRLIAEGKSYGHIASELGITPEAVKERVQSVVDKLGAVDKTHAVTIVFRAGVIQ